MRIIVIFLFIVTFSLAKEDSYYISLGNYNSHIDATKQLAKVDSDTFIQELQKRYGFRVTLRKKGEYFQVLLIGFNTPSTIPTLYNLLKYDYLSLQTNYRIVETKKSSDILWFIILFVMFTIIGLVFILRSSKKYKALEEEYRRLKNLKDHLSAKHDEVLSNLGYKIENSTKNMITARDKIINEPIKEFTREVVEKKFKSIKDTDKILTDTTDQIIDFLKAKSGKLQLKNKRFDINRLLDLISSFVSQNYRGKSVELIYEVNVETPRYLIGDVKRLSEMLISIVEYSYQHTTSGYIKVVLSKFDHIADKSMIEFKILDSSVGVKKAQQEALFIPFHNRDSKGGLFIVKELAKLMGGKMEFVSRYGKGNTFAINIPLVVAEIQEGYKLSSDVVSIKELENKYVGIIDKSESVANAISKSFLHFMKNVSTVAHYSLEDYDVLNRYDLVLIEHSMITTKLLDYFQKIQENREYYVVGTHSRLNSEYVEIIDNSISQYISKPLTPAFARKLFLDEFSRVKLVNSVSEMIYMEHMGSDFHSRLPKQYPEPMIETKDASKDFFKDFFGSSVLIINANRVNQDIFSDLMDDSGIKCAVASNRKDTMEQLGKYYNNFNLIIIDMDSIDSQDYLLVKMIRSSHNYDTIPIVAIVDEHYDENEILKVGVNGYIIKPARIGNIYTAMNCFLDKVDLSSPFVKLSKSEHILDITRGIMQSNHDARAYLELVKEFKDAYGNSDQKFQNLIDNQNYPKLKELIVNMKGLSNILAAYNMNQLLEELAIVLDTQQYEKLAQYSQRYTQELDNLTTNIEIYIRSVDV